MLKRTDKLLSTWCRTDTLMNEKQFKYFCDTLKMIVRYEIGDTEPLLSEINKKHMLHIHEIQLIYLEKMHDILNEVVQYQINKNKNKNKGEI